MPPDLRQVVLDATDIRSLAEFYRELLGFVYRPGDEPPPAGQPDERSQEWLVLRPPSGCPAPAAQPRLAIAFQPVSFLPKPTWPSAEVAQQMHLDLSVRDVQQLNAEHKRAIGFGATLLFDRSGDPEEPLRVYADPAGHPFCIFVAPAM